MKAGDYRCLLRSHLGKIKLVWSHCAFGTGIIADFGGSHMVEKRLLRWKFYERLKEHIRNHIEVIYNRNFIRIYSEFDWFVSVSFDFKGDL